MFDGEFKRHLDVKGRVMVPAEYREKIDGDILHVILGFEQNLMLLLPKHYEQIRDYVASLNLLDANARRMRRMFIAKAKTLSIDANNRIRIPSDLLELTGFESGSSVILAGNGNYVELWTEQRWQEFNQSLMDPSMNEERFKDFTIILSSPDSEETPPPLII
jgi:MraZ protein